MVAAASTLFDSPVGPLELLRYPRRSEEGLQAWCSADTLLIEAALELNPTPDQTLVVNDEHGALTTALAPGALWIDSAMAAKAATDNLARNSHPSVALRWSVDSPGTGYHLVVLRVPKQLAYFQYQLAALSNAMVEGGILICGGMDKHLSPQTAGMIEKLFGPVTRHRGKRKARLFSATKEPGTSSTPAPPAQYYCEALDATLTARANVFSSDSLDIGSRFLIEQLPGIEAAETVADLACGNGALGFCALKAGVGKALTLCDESAMAIASAQDNAAALGLVQSTAFHHGDGFTGLEQKFDRILCNPPFHLGHTVDDFAGRRLLSQCAEHLRPGGALYVVANRHLDYGRTLKQYFDGVERLAQDKKFTVWTARRG